MCGGSLEFTIRIAQEKLVKQGYHTSLAEGVTFTVLVQLPSKKFV